MIVRQVLEEDLETIKKWYELRGLETSMSDLGFIVPNIAAGFLYTSNSKIASIEGFVTNPKASARLKKQAIKLISQEIINKSKQLGFKELIGTSFYSGIIKQAKELGFSIHDKQFTVFTLDLG